MKANAIRLLGDDQRTLRAIFGYPNTPKILVTEIRHGREVIVCNDCDRAQLARGFNAGQLVDCGWRFRHSVWRCPICA